MGRESQRKVGQDKKGSPKNGSLAGMKAEVAAIDKSNADAMQALERATAALAAATAPKVGADTSNHASDPTPPMMGPEQAVHTADEVDTMLEKLQEKIRENPDDADAHYDLAYEFQKIGEEAKAISEYKEVIRINPSESGAYNNLGCSLEKIGDLDGAIAAYGKAIELRPDYEKAKGNLARTISSLENRAITDKEAVKEIKQLPEQEKKEVLWGLRTFGFKLDMEKNQFFANLVGKFASTDQDKQGVFTRFIRAASTKFQKSADKSREKALDIQEGKYSSDIKNLSLPAGALVRYGRVVADFAGKTVASPMRYAMMGAMGFTGLMDITKETVFSGSKHLDKTRLEKNVAEEEAWDLYNEAKKNSFDGSVSSEQLTRTYFLDKMPKKMMEKLKNPTDANGMVQSAISRATILNLEWMERQLKDLDSKNLSEEEKLNREKKIFTKWESVLQDYDRAFTNVGTMDSLAMGIRYLQNAGKIAVAGMTVETLYLSGTKIANTLHDIYSSGATVQHQDLSNINSQDFSTHKEGVASAVSPTEQTLQSRVGSGAKLPNGTYIEGHPDTASSVAGQPNSSAKIPNIDNVKPFTKEQLDEILKNTPKLSGGVNIPEAHEVNVDAVVHKGEGVEHAFIRQIENDPKLAQDLGYKGNITDKAALHKFAGREAHIIAMETGYVDVNNGGQEIRVTEADKVAYELKVENGSRVVTEKLADGKVLGKYHEGDEFGDNPNNKYEKIVDTGTKSARKIGALAGDKITNSEKVLGGMQSKSMTQEEIQELLKNNSVDIGKIEVPKGEINEVEIARAMNENGISRDEALEYLGYTSGNEGVSDMNEVNIKLMMESRPGIDRKEAIRLLGIHTENDAVTARNVVESHYGETRSMRQPIPEVTNQATYKPYNEPTQAMKNWAEQQNANATYQPYNNRIGGGFFGGGAERFSDISPGEQALLKGHTGFWDNPFGLPGKQVVEAYNINQTNMSHIFTSNNIGEWKEMKSERIGDILNDTKFQNDPKWQGIVRHVKRLREITGLKPSRGFLWLTGESVEHYIARATMLAVASGQGDSVRLR